MRCRIVVMLVVLVTFFGTALSLAQDQPTPTKETGYLGNLLNNGVPAGIGELIGLAQKSIETDITNITKKGGQITGDLAAKKIYRDKIAELNQWFGILYGLADVGMKVYYEQYDEALISSATTGISIFSATSGGGAFLKSIGITGPMVAAAAVGTQLYIESHRQLAQERIASELQQVYGTMERMTRDRNRTIGEGDPFPVTPENVEKAWQRILVDQNFRNLFRTYVTNQLQQDFPDFSLTEKQAMAGNFGYGMVPLHDPQLIEWTREIAERELAEKIKAEEQRIRTYIAGLVGILNKAEKKREQAVVLHQAVQQVIRRLEMNNESYDQVLDKMQKALEDMWFAKSKAESCSADIAKAAAENDYAALRGHALTITNLVKDVLAWIPNTGPLASEREEAFTALNRCYEQIGRSVEDIRVQLRAEAEKRPKTSDGKEMEISYQAPTPETFYQTHFAKLIQPFDWQGNQDPEAIKPLFIGYLEAANFRSQVDPPGAPLPPGREPLADLLTEAWRKQNYDVAFSGVRAGMQIATPDPKITIEGHYQGILDQIFDKNLEDRQPEVKMLREQIAAIYDEYRVIIDALTDRLVSLRSSTIDPATSRQIDHLRWEISRAESARSQLTSPSYSRIRPFVQNNQVAIQMVRNRVELEKNLALDKHQEILIWMEGARGPYEARAREMFDLAKIIRNDFSLIAQGLVPEDGQPPKAQAIIENLLDAQAAHPFSFRDIGIGKISTRTSDLKHAVEYNVEQRKEQLMSSAPRLFDRGHSYLNHHEQLIAGYQQAGKEWERVSALWAPELPQVRLFLGQDFLRDEEFQRWQARFKKTDSYVSDMAGGFDSARAQLQRRVDEIYADAFWLNSVLLNFQDFVETGFNYNILEYNPGSGLEVPKISGTRPIIVSEPYRQYLTTAKKNQGLSVLRQIYNSSNLSGFGKDVAPWFGDGVEALLRQIEGLSTFPEENFFPMHATEANAWSGDAVGRSGIAEAERLIAALQPGTAEFAEKLRVASGRGALGIFIGRDNVLYDSNWRAPSESPLAAAYQALQAKVRELVARHIPLDEQRRQQEQEDQIKQAIAQLQSMISTLQGRVRDGHGLIDEIKRLAQANTINLDKGLAELDKFHNQILDAPYHSFLAALNLLQGARPGHALVSSGAAVAQSISQLNSALYEAKEFLRQLLSRPVDQTGEVLKFYDQFKQAYERKNDSRLMSFLDDRWSAGDGTSLYDVEDYFRNMFRVFDEIRLDMRGLRVEPIGDGRYLASYDLTIIGRIYAHNMEHSEKSSVMEELGTDRSGRLKIIRTPQGRFWHQ